MKSRNTHIYVLLLVLLTQAAPAGHAVQQRTTQQPGAVEIETSRRRSGTGPTVLVTVDKSRVRVGQQVTFTLWPANVVTDPRYRVTVDFGDGTTAVVKEPQVVYRYRALGHYDVFAQTATLKTDDPDSPEPAPRIPRVSLIVASRNAPGGNTVAFVARISHRYPNLKYRFAFGDKSQTEWQASAETTHVYPGAGTYEAYVDIGVGDGSFVKQVGGSARQVIEVTGSSLGAVDLIVNPTPATAGEAVTLSARVNTSDPNIRYRFTFGDGSPATAWQGNPQSSHSYAVAGTYPAFVDVGIASSRGIRQVGSAREPVQITATPSPTVSLNANPTSIEAGQSATFEARVSSGGPNIKYRFVFGDGTPASSWQDSARTTHNYISAGNYSAYVEIAENNRGRLTPVGKSAVTQINVTPAATAEASPSPGTVASPSPTASTGGGGTNGNTNTNSGSEGGTNSWNFLRDTFGDPANDWWKYLLLLLLLVGGYWAWKYLFKPAPTFHAYPDNNVLTMNAVSPDLKVDFEVLLHPNVAEAQYLVFTDEANVVRSVRKENG